MAGTSIFTRKDGLKQDQLLHEPVLDAVNFPRSPAFRFSLKRATKLGLTEAQAREVMNTKTEQDG